jgi:predicted SnoaL-like aldol condensation-catalyzing enzyme
MEDVMNKLVVALVALAFTVASPEAQAQGGDAAKLERNKQIVTALYNAALNEKDFEKARQYLGDKYIQHNPNAADGPEGLKAFIEFLRQKFPNNNSEIKRIFAEGDYVIVHVHAVREPGTRGFAIIDIFRLEGDKVVEHWDVVQAVPEKAMNDNGMF